MKRRLDQVLASLGYGSRSAARQLILDGRVTVDGEVIENPAAKAEPSAVRLDGERLDHAQGIFVMLHKPVGYVCSHDPREGPRVYDLLPARWLDRNPAPTSVGRLDKDSSGLLLITDDAPLVHRLTSPKRKEPKVYAITLDKPCDPRLVEEFAAGRLRLEGDHAPCAPAELRLLGGAECELTLTEGRYRQARRMFAHFGFEVLRLRRTRFGAWELGELPEGHWVDAPRIAPDGKLA